MILGVGLVSSAFVANGQRAVCPPDTVLFSLEKATEIDTLVMDPVLTYAAYQYFEAPQEITLSGMRFYGFKTDTAGGDTMTVTIELRNASLNDSVPGNNLLASVDLILNLPDSFNGPMGQYANVVTWSPVQVDGPYSLVVRTAPNNPDFSLLHNKLAGAASDGNEEWLSGVRQGTSWIRSYSFLVGGNPFDADFFFEPIVDYNINAGFTNDPECLFDELGEYVNFENTGAPIVDSRMYNRFAFYGLDDRQTWNFGDGTPVVQSSNPGHFYPTNGPFAATMSLKLLSWTSQLCESTVTQIIKEKPKQDFSYVTNNLDVQFTNETFGLFSNIEYDFGDGNSSLSEDPKHKYAEPGTYWVCQTMQTSCGEITQCKNVAVATNTALNCGKDSVKFTTARGTTAKMIKLKKENPNRLFGVGQIFDATQPMIVHGFTFYANHEGLFKDSYPVECRIWRKGFNKLPDSSALAESVVHINKFDVDTSYSDTVRYTAIFDKPVNLDFDYILTIEFDTTTDYNVPVLIGSNDWLEHDGDGDLLAIGKINDTTWVTAASVSVFNQGGAAFDADVLIEPLVEYNLDANFLWDVECLDLEVSNSVEFKDTSSTIIRSKIYNTIPFYGSSIQAFEWNFDDGTPIGNFINPQHNFQGPGPFDVTLLIRMEGWTVTCVSSQTHNIPVYPTGGFAYEQVVSTVQFFDSSYNAEAYLWTFSDSTVSTLSDPIHYFTSVGTFEVCQYVSNECGSDTICEDITINVVGIPEAFMERMRIYPNPAVDQLNIEADLSVMGTLDVSLMDLSGRRVKELSFEDASVNRQLYVGDLARGTYLLHIKAGEFEGTRKIVLTR